MLFVRQLIQRRQRGHCRTGHHDAAQHVHGIYFPGTHLAEQHRVQWEARRHLHGPGAQDGRQVKVRGDALDLGDAALKNARSPQRVHEPCAHIEGQRHALAQQRRDT